MIYNKKIGVDLHDTIVDFIGNFILYNNENFERKITRADFIKYSFDYVLQKPLEEVIQIVDSFYQSEYFKHIPPIEDAFSALSLLKEKSDIYLITSCPDFLKKDTELLLEENFPRIFSDVFYSYNHYSKRKNCGKTKTELCRENGILLMIDDTLEYCTQCAKGGIDTFLFGDYPWNKSENLNPKINRTKTWKKVLKEYGY
ncbi:MAG: hypothetical protein M1416_00595 [Candidatus Pacearchaeota archaeon]|nr:hypothetical protein [Candidatus Pacearchaeota archaeon]